MKKTILNGLACVVLAGAMMLNGFNIGECRAGTIIKTQSWKQKLSSELKEKAADFDNNDQEKVKVYIWYADIDQEAVDERVEAETGLTREKLDSSLSISEDKIVDMVEQHKNNTQAADTGSDKIHEYLDDEKEKIAEVKEETATFIQTRREIAKKDYEKKYQKIKEKINIPEERYIFKSRYAPMVIAELSYSEIKRVAGYAEIEKLSLYQEAWTYPEWSYSPRNSTVLNCGDNINNLLNNNGYKQIDLKTGLSGKGVKVGVLEAGIDPTETMSHQEAVCALVKGIAPQSTINLKISVIDRDTDYYRLIEEFLDEGVQVINCSFGMSSDTSYDLPDQWFDHAVYEHNLIIVNSAGNNWADGKITAPAMAYNVITVGAIYDNDSIEFDDDELLRISSGNYKDGCFKPDLLASGCFLEGGTSFAAPLVTGTIALMLELDPALATSPQAVKAILMAGCHRKVKGETNETGAALGGLIAQQGAGVLDVFKTLSVVRQKQYDIRTSREEKDTIRLVQPPYGAKRMNISLAWLRKSVASDYDLEARPTVGTLQNLNMYVYPNDRESSVLKQSILPNSSTEMVTIDMNQSNFTYYLSIKRNTIINSEPIRYAYAWSTDQDDAYYNRTVTGIYTIKNKSTGLYLDQNGVSGTNNVLQYTYHGGLNQQWIVKKTNENTGYLKSAMVYTMGTLSGGTAIDSVWRYATIAPAEKFEVEINQEEDGSYTFLHKDSSTGQIMLLTPYDNSTQTGSKICWAPYQYQPRINQKWYLEKINYQKGDVDINGALTDTDIIKLTEYLSTAAGLSGLQQYLADINDDGIVNAMDKALLQQLLEKIS